LALGWDGSKEGIELKTGPGVIEHGQTAIIEGLVKLELIGREEDMALQRGGDEIACGGREAGDVADCAGARTSGGVEGFSDEIGKIGFAVFAGGGSGLNEHELHDL